MMSKSVFLCCFGHSKKNCDEHESMLSSNTASSLTEEDVRLIREISDVIFKNRKLEDMGADFLIMFFGIYPEFQNHFKALKGVPLSDLKNLSFTNNHGKRVINRIYLFIQHLDDPSQLQKDMRDVVSTHAIRKITSADFKLLLDVFLLFLKQELQDQFTHQQEQAWIRLMNYLQVVYDKGVAIYDHSEELIESHSAASHTSL